jgi:hypothetical protein
MCVWPLLILENVRGLWREPLCLGARLCRVRSTWAASRTTGPCRAGYLEAEPWACEPLVRAGCFCAPLLSGGPEQLQGI